MKIEYIGILLFIIIITISSFFILSYGWINNFFVGTCIFIAIIAIVFFLVIQQNSIFRNLWAKPSNIFLLSLFIVSFQWLAELLYGYTGPIPNLLNGSEQLLNHGSIISLIGILSFCLGYTIKIDKLKVKYTLNNYEAPTWLLIILNYVLFILFLIHINLNDFLSGTIYMSSNEVTTFGYYEYLFNISCFATISQCILNQCNIPHRNGIIKYIQIYPIPFWIPVISYLLLRLSSGDRGPVIYTSSAFFYAYIILTHRRIKFRILFTMVICAGVAISVMGIARQMDSRLNLIERIQDAFSKYSNQGRFGNQTIFSPTQELSISFCCNQIALREIELNNESFHLGTYQISYLLNTIPFAPSFFKNNLKIEDENLSSSAYVSNKQLGKNSNWKLGSSMTADFFLDFGIIGVAIGFIIVGIIMCWIDKYIYIVPLNKLSPFLLSFALFYSSKAIYLPRSMFLIEFRAVIYIWILLKLNKLIFNNWKY